MKNIIKGNFLICGLVMALACGCSETQDILDTPSLQPYSITVAVDENSVVTSRTAVVDPNNNRRGKQHVTRVQLYIYKQEGNDYICVASEDVKWNHLNGAENGLDTRQKRYTTQYQDYEDNVNYLFLAIGFDDTFSGSIDNPLFDGVNSVAAYGNPESIATIGSKLSNGHFRLQEGAGKDLIAHSELFAGSRVFTNEKLKNGTAVTQPIELYRRVAGIVGYFKNLPKEIEESEVKKVFLRLYQNQNTEIYFLPKFPEKYDEPKQVPDEEYEDFITSPFEGGNGEIICTYNVSENDKGVFTLSAYMLPAEASKDKGQSTLELVFQCKNQKEFTRRILWAGTIQSRSGTGIIDTPEDVTDSPAMHYPIRANQFYRMGEKGNPIDLSGQTSYIFIEIDPIWDEYYGGAMDNGNVPPGLGIDKEWGEHDGGTLGGDKK